jgi:hypothetical protein
MSIDLATSNPLSTSAPATATAFRLHVISRATDLMQVLTQLKQDMHELELGQQRKNNNVRKGEKNALQKLVVRVL